MKIKFYKGFTLLELLAVVLIICLIAVVAQKMVSKYLLKSKVSTLSEIGQSITKKSLVYYEMNGTYPTAAELGYNTKVDKRTVTDPQSISPYLSNLYIPGSISDDNNGSNPMGYVLMTVNKDEFPSAMVDGDNPGFVAYSFGKNLENDDDSFVIGCETAFAVDNLAGASGDYSYVTCSSGVPYKGGGGSGGADLPQVCAGCSLNTVLAASNGGGSSGSGGSINNGIVTLDQSTGGGLPSVNAAINQTITTINGVLQNLLDTYNSTGSFPNSFDIGGTTVANGAFYPEVNYQNAVLMNYHLLNNGQAIILETVSSGLDGVPNYAGGRIAATMGYAIRMINGIPVLKCGYWGGYIAYTIPQPFAPSTCNCDIAMFGYTGRC